MRIGCLARFENPYADAVRFAEQHGFGILQIWYDRDGIRLHETDSSPIDAIRRHAHPAILHAVLDLNEFDIHIPILAQILASLGHRHLIIHPVCKSEPLTATSIQKLADKAEAALRILTPLGVTVYLESNSRLDPIFSTPEELTLVFAQNPQLQLLLDIAHITGYDHLAALLAVRHPAMLHIADRHFDAVHEHLPLGRGDLDFRRIFRDVLPDFSGHAILEIVGSDEDVIRSKEHLENCLR